MAHQYVHHYQMKEDVTDDTLQYLQKQELKQIQSHMKSNRRYLLNYTECLKEKFSNFENIVSLKKMKFPLSFNEMMLRFHKECGSEILDEVEICNLRQQKTSKIFPIPQLQKPLKFLAFYYLFSFTCIDFVAKLWVILTFDVGANPQRA